MEVLDCGPECRAFKEKFEGGVMSHQVGQLVCILLLGPRLTYRTNSCLGCLLQGDIYCIPLRAKHVVKLVPAVPKGYQPATPAEINEARTTSYGGNE